MAVTVMQCAQCPISLTLSLHSHGRCEYDCMMPELLITSCNLRGTYNI